MFTIEMLPARNGDCLWIEYGNKRRPRRILIDGGRDYTYGQQLRGHLEARLGHLPEDERVIELLVITHVDADHIGGVLELLEANPLGITIGDVWFNGYHHLPGTPPDILGPVQGERLSALIVNRELPWNEAFGGEAIVVPDSGALTFAKLAGGMKLTVLSPLGAGLEELRGFWDDEVKKAGLVPGFGAVSERDEEEPPDLLGEIPDPRLLAASEFEPDSSPANGSSIALLAEYRGKRALLLGDAFPEVVAAGIDRLKDERRTANLDIDAVKISHHGGKKNTSVEMLEHTGSRRFLFSTDGSYSFKHPHPESVARVVVGVAEGATLYFNYRTEFNEPWDAFALKDEYGYETVYPEPGTEGLMVEV